MRFVLLLALVQPSDRGELTHFGNKWCWAGTGEVFVPQLVMYATPPNFYWEPREGRCRRALVSGHVRLPWVSRFRLMSMVRHRWVDNSQGTSGFEVERARGEGVTPGTFEIIAALPPGATRFTDRDASPGAAYWYRVRALTTRGATGYTEARRVSSAATASLITELRPSNYGLTTLGVGERYYIDRAYTLASFPSVLDGGFLMRTANDDKLARGAGFLSFRLARAATIYVGFDRRAQRLPYWLDEWEAVKGRVEIQGDAMRFFELYRREFPAGRVVLGGNRAAGGDWGDEGTSQYIVVLAPE